MQLLVDENLQEATLTFLRRLGHDVRGVQEEGLTSADDQIIFHHARRTERVLSTYNVDFVDIRELTGMHHSGVIRLRIRNQRLADMHPILAAALDQLREHDLADSLVTVSDDRIRIRNTFSL
jgi:predicted nuclease of predicted toxin-antitoxin system